MIKLPQNPFIIWIRERINQNKNAMILINGATGSGKSYSCLSLAREVANDLNTSFSVENNVAFKFTELLEKMNLPENQSPGTVFIFEEVGSVGSGASARKWQSQANQFFFSFAQTSRHRNQILFMNCPNFSFLEKGTRSLIHFQLECNGIDFKKKIAYLKPYRIQINSRTGKFYFKFLRIKYNGLSIKFNQLAVKHPEMVDVKVYEAMKTDFTTKLNKMIIEEETKKPMKRKVEPYRVKELLEQGLTQKEIGFRLGVTPKTIRKYKKLIITNKIPKKV